MDERKKNIVIVSVIGFLILIMMIFFCKFSFDKLMNKSERTKKHNPNIVNNAVSDANCIIDWRMSDMVVHQLARAQDENVKAMIREGYKEYFNSNSDLLDVESKIIKELPKGFGNRRPQSLVSVPITVEHPTSIDQICDIIKKRPSFSINGAENTAETDATAKYHQDFIITNNKEGVYTIYMIFYDSGA
ncbi:hypothetical protein [Clostridium cellulovorans]|uniref:Uncharacterized protein n=1 Tax=Clostridium cellulovorans (strain ATCC 35296 / DSM 3052 / OCM 3 / 743B) TaxID=573061 RepID=D9SQ97_CLOC7|nr:hypothetical protein [Clostridium cellulovorans]ADL50164.1 hypothetical protein Clocel_0384 [Clostridium cellulovorans 743B]